MLRNAHDPTRQRRPTHTERRRPSDAQRCAGLPRPLRAHRGRPELHAEPYIGPAGWRRNVDIEVEQITEISAGGINHNLDIYVGETLHRFSGRGAIRVHNRLLALIAEGEEEGSEESAFRPGEQVLLQGQGELFVNELIGVRGEITFTDYRLRFAPGLGLEQLIWNTTSLDAPLASIQECR